MNHGAVGIVLMWTHHSICDLVLPPLPGHFGAERRQVGGPAAPRRVARPGGWGPVRRAAQPRGARADGRGRQEECQSASKAAFFLCMVGCHRRSFPWWLPH